MVNNRTPTVNRQRPATYEDDSLNELTFSYTGDLHIRGDVTVEKLLFVGGHLEVDGNLDVGDLFCIGQVHVKGNIKGNDAVVGISIKADGNICLSSLETGKDSDYIVALTGLENDSTDEDEMDIFDRLIDPIIADELDGQRDEGLPAIEVGGELDCYTLDAHWDVIVNGGFDVDDAEIAGSLSAKSIYLEGDLTVQQCLSSRGNIYCDTLFASDISCGGNLSSCSVIADGGDVNVMGSIIVTGDLTAMDGHIQAGKWIAASGRIESGLYIKTGEFLISDKEIIAGDDYGIFAGLGIPRSQWMERGYISAPNSPENILSGRFVAGKTTETVLYEENDDEVE